ncbi:MAG: hypothetical protein FJ267_13840, partial [Planctomycetes bacterium]|nr:hypothetical protein [Planctomycetota bacterium]
MRFRRRNWISMFWMIGMVGGLLTGSASLKADAADEVTFKKGPEGLAVMIGNAEFTVLRTDESLPKPFFAPVRAADGAIITRMVGDPVDKDHPHHKGIWLSV